MTEKSLIVQHNEIIEAKYKLSIGEQRLIKLLVSMIDKDDEDFKVYQISVKQLSDLLGLSDNDFYRKIKVISKKLISNVLVFRNRNDDRELQVAWLSSAEYIKDKGIVELEFSPKLKPFLLQLKSHFTSYELGNVINLKHTYSIRIYELLKQYEKIGKRKFDISDFREALALEDNEYKQFSDFRKRILKTAQEELAEKTDISFIWQEEKQNQKCVAIEFIITSQKRSQVGLKLLETPTQQEPEAKIEQLPYQEPPKQDVPRPPLPPQDQFSARKQKQIEILFDMGVAMYAVEKLLASFDANRIDQGIAYTIEKQKDGTAKDPAAFVIAAIERGFVDPQAQEKAKQAEVLRLRQEQEKAYEEVRQRWEMVKKQYNDWNNEIFANVMQNMTAEELESRKQEFMQSSFYASSSRHIDLDKGIGKNFLFGHIRGKLGLDTFEVWAQKNAVNISVFPAEMLNEMRPIPIVPL